MKQINRIKTAMTIIAIIFGYIIVANLNPYINAAVILTSVTLYILAMAWVLDNPTEKEQRTIEQMNKVLN